MRPETLQALRRLLFYTRQEAAALVAASPERPRGVTDRAWRMWEVGELLIPDDVAARLRHLCEWRARAIKAGVTAARSALKRHGRPNEIVLTWYPTLADWLARDEKDDAIYWRPHCSVVAAIASEVPEIELSASRAAQQNYDPHHPRRP